MRHSRSNPAPLRQAAIGAICKQEVGWQARKLVEMAELPCIRRLNCSQSAACAAAAGGALTLVQGPPGTGKTHVAIAILISWVRSGCLGSGAALATSDSNIAVDNLLEGLANAGVRVVRLGRPDSVRPELLKFCPDAGGPSTGDRHADYAAKLAAIKGAQVVCATCVGVGAEMLKGISFPAVLVDEATQATEAATLVALCRGAKQMVLLGDHCQLPPTLVSRHPASLCASAPLFTRLHADGAPSYLLDTQYRMHPAIAQLPADLVYGGHLISGTPPEHRMPPQGFEWPRVDMPVAMVPVYGSETGEGTSKSNRSEAEAVARVVQGLQYAGVRAADIGVISPYGAQVHLLRSLIRAGGGGGGARGGGDGQVEVSSVDGFQGREKEVIIFSCVRSNSHGNLGFLADARRLNVAFTRAKRGLVVLGHPPTLAMDRDGPWAHWLRWARAYGLVMREPTSGEYDAAATRARSGPLMRSYEPPSVEVEAARESARVATVKMPRWIELAEAHKGDAAALAKTQAEASARARAEARADQDGALPPGWQAVDDPAGQGTYYYHESGETAWERPRRQQRSSRSHSRDSRDSRDRSRSGSRRRRRSYSRSRSSSYSRSGSRSRGRGRDASPPRRRSRSPERRGFREEPRVSAASAASSGHGATLMSNSAASAANGHGPVSLANAALPPPPSSLPAQWTAVHTAEGAVYYWNQATGETSWGKPV